MSNNRHNRLGGLAPTQVLFARLCAIADDCREAKQRRLRAKIDAAQEASEGAEERVRELLDGYIRGLY